MAQLYKKYHLRKNRLEKSYLFGGLCRQIHQTKIERVNQTVSTSSLHVRIYGNICTAVRLH